MLNGVEIINKTDIMLEQSVANPAIDIIFKILTIIGISIFALILVVLLATGILSVVPKFTEQMNAFIHKLMSTWYLLIVLGVTWFGTLTSACIWSINHSRVEEIPSGEYLYEVTVSDEVSLNEFCNYYEIIEINEDIFTVKLRGESSNENE